MSKIGKRLISVPEGVTVTVEGPEVVVVGPKGSLRWKYPEGIKILVADGVLTVSRGDDSDAQRALHGLTRALVANMIRGVAEGYSKQLKLVGVGFRAETTGNGIRLSLGFSHPIDIPALPGIGFTIDKNVITITGIDRQLVGETAARIRALKKPEPYKGKGVMYVDELVRRKPGKAVKAVGPGAGGAG